MEWIHHHNPDLVILNDKNQEVERIDLNGFTLRIQGTPVNAGYDSAEVWINHRKRKAPSNQFWL